MQQFYKEYLEKCVALEFEFAQAEVCSSDWEAVALSSSLHVSIVVFGASIEDEPWRPSRQRTEGLRHVIVPSMISCAPIQITTMKEMMEIESTLKV